MGKLIPLAVRATTAAVMLDMEGCALAHDQNPIKCLGALPPRQRL